MEKIITFIQKNKAVLLLLLIFAAALVMRLAVLGFDDYPVQARTLDSSYNIAMVEWMSEGNFELMPPYLALGYADVIQFHPPLLYLIPAGISKLGILPWNAAWLYFSLLSALCCIMLFLIGKKIHSEEAGLIASALYVFPYPSIWIFPLFNGMWSTVAGQSLLLIEIVLLWQYYHNGNRKVCALLGAVIALQFLSHFPETIIFAPFLLFVFAMKFAKNKKMQPKVAIDLGIVLILPFLALLWQLPHILNVWFKQVKTGFHFAPQITSRLDSIIEMASKTDIFMLQLPIILLAITCIIFLIRKKELYWTSTACYFIFIPLVIPYFVQEGEFFVKMRFFLPLIAYPLAAAGLMVLISFVRLKKVSAFFIVFLLLVMSVLSFAGFSDRHPVLSKEKYGVLKWIEQNTEENSTIIFLSGYDKFTSSFSHRPCYEVDLSLNSAVQYPGMWCGFFWDDNYRENYLLPYKKGFLEYGYHESVKATLEEFDYAVYVDPYEKLVNFEEVHHTNGIHVLKNCQTTC